jgi:hypothetical protein
LTLLQYVLIFLTIVPTDFLNPFSRATIQNFQRVYLWFDIHRSVHRGWFSRNTNKMQRCNIIYYYKVYWRLNMFRAAHHSSSGALNCVCSLWFIYPWGDRLLPRLSGKWIHFPLSFGNGRYINQRLQTQFRTPDDEGCAAQNMFSLR